MNSAWFGLLRMQLGAYTLVILCHLETSGQALPTPKTPATPSAPGQAGESANSIFGMGGTVQPLTALLPKLSEFQTVFNYARLDLPGEPRPLLLRQFAKRETLLFLHFQVKSGTVTFPQPRPLPEVQTRELYAQFWAMFGEARAAFAGSGTGSAGVGARELTFARDFYRFHARVDPEQELYALFASDAVNLEHVQAHVQEILANVQRQL